MAYTVREHYIPQFYLRNFSSDQKRIYQYEIGSNKPSKLVPIESVCCVDDLYEFKNDDGEITDRNRIEKAFAVFEGEFHNVISSIVSKARHTENLYTPCFLTQKEKAMLVFFLATSVLRTPTMVDEAQKAALKFFGDTISKQDARNLVLQELFPIYKELNGDDKNALYPTLKWFENMSFHIGVTWWDCLVTCDRPVIVRGNHKVFQPEGVLFPLTPNLALTMLTIKKTRACNRNKLAYLDGYSINVLNSEIIANCNRWIFSKDEITSEQIKFIEKVRKEQYN